MTNRSAPVFLVWAFFSVLASAAGCAANPAAPLPAGSGGRSAGTGGGSPGSGGGPGGGGGATPLLLGMGPHPFPQNKKPGNCSLTTAANPSAAAQTAYNAWKAAFVTASGAGGALRVQRSSKDQFDTVSEGIGYGMMASVYMADRATFDGLWAYAGAHFDAQGLMRWKIAASGVTIEQWSASDGDVDMAWALIMASEQWSASTYLDAAASLINAMSTYSIGSDGMLEPGDHWGSANALTNPSYFSPAYFRVFAKVSRNTNWSGPIIDRNYQILSAVSGTQGLVPDWTTNQNALNQGLLPGGSFDSSTYGYDACRTPWRIAMDYCFNNEPRARDYLLKVGGFFAPIGAPSIADGYSVTGAPKGSGDKNMSFIGSVGAAAMVGGFPSLLDGAFAFGVNSTSNDYFKDSLRVLTMLMMSGNFLDYTKP